MLPVFLGKVDKMSRKRAFFVILTVLVAFTAVSSKVYSHSQSPCGIYDDQARFKLMHEHSFDNDAASDEEINKALHMLDRIARVE